MKVVANGINPNFKNYAPALKSNAAASSSLSQAAGMANNAAYPDASVLKANFISFKGNPETEEPENEEFNPEKVLDEAIEQTECNFIDSEFKKEVLSVLNKYNAPYLPNYMDKYSLPGCQRNNIDDRKRFLISRLKMAGKIEGIEGISNGQKKRIIDTLANTISWGNLVYDHPDEIAELIDETNAGYFDDFEQRFLVNSLKKHLRMVSTIKGKKGISDELKKSIIDYLAYTYTCNEYDESKKFTNPDETAELIDETNVDYFNSLVCQFRDYELEERLKMISAIKGKEGISDEEKERIIETLRGRNFLHPDRIAEAIDKTNIHYFDDFRQIFCEKDLEMLLRMISIIKSKNGISKQAKDKILESLVYAGQNG